MLTMNEWFCEYFWYVYLSSVIWSFLITHLFWYALKTINGILLLVKKKSKMKPVIQDYCFRCKWIMWNVYYISVWVHCTIKYWSELLSGLKKDVSLLVNYPPTPRESTYYLLIYFFSRVLIIWKYFSTRRWTINSKMYN